MKFPSGRLLDLLYKAYYAWPQFYSGSTQLLSALQWEKWQDRVFDDLQGKKVLEIGVGPGKLLIRMAKKNFDVTGVELRSGMAHEARKRTREAGFDIDILHTSVYDLPFADSSFDSIVMTFVLAEIKHLDQAIVQMKRVLKPGGRIIVIAGGMPQDRNIFARIVFRVVSSGTTLRLERDNVAHFEKFGFSVTREDFGPFNIVNKIVAVKK